MPYSAFSLKKKPIIVVGGGLAGLRATATIAEKGVPVLLFSLCPVKRSHSVCAQGGINAAVNIKGEGDSIEHHFYDTVYGGDFLANQTPIKKMCEEAPNIIYLLDRFLTFFYLVLDQSNGLILNIFVGTLSPVFSPFFL